MSQQTAYDGDFRRVSDQRSGYKVSQVDAFFATLADDFELLMSEMPVSKDTNTSRTIRQKTFEAETGGYLPSAVDRALDRVEDRFAEVERRRYIQRYGDTAWQEAVEDLRELLLGRLERPAGKRFRHPSHKLTKGYLAKDVDRLCERLLSAVDGGGQLLPEELRKAAFRSAVGSESYDETQVDAFMDRAIEYLHDTL